MIHHTSTWRSGSRLVALCLALLIMALGVMTASAAPTCTTTCYADAVNGDDTNDGTTAATALKTIQAAVNQVTAGGQVFALAGTYPESVLVNKPVTITGDGPTQTIIDPVAGNGFNISASTVKIEDLKVQGATAHGVVINTPVANTTFDNVHFVSNTSRGIDIGVAGVTNVSVLNSLFDANSTGIRMASAATVDGILIENTTFQNHTGSGFNQANDGNAGWVKNLTVRDSTFTNNGTTSGHAGVYAEEYSNVLIEDSTFSGNQYGINLWDVYNAAASVTTNVIVRNNTFTDHKYATIALQSRTSDPNAQLFLVENNTINQNVGALVGVTQAHLAVTTSSANPNGAVDVVDNTLTFSGTFPTGILATYGVYLAGGLQDVRVEGNEIDGGNVGTNGATIPSSGIRLITNIFQTGANITITKNLINNFVNGVTIHDANNVMGGVQANSTVTITRNDLSGNSAYGIQSGPATESGGTCNWWGDVSGPSGVGPGTGSAVSTDVDYDPWLYTADLDGPCYIGGTIEVVKQAGDVGEQFEFDPSWSDDNFLLYSGGGYVTNPPLEPGVYSVSEVNLPAGWSLESASCVNEGGLSSPVEPIDPSNIPVEDYDQWVCTFTNVYTPPPTNVCPVEDAGHLYTDIIGMGMGNTKKHKTQLKLNVPNWTNVDTLYGQLVGKDSGKANYVRFFLPGKNNFVQVNTITSPLEHFGGNFWYGAYLPPSQWVKARWYLQKSGVKGHLPRAFVLYPTYEDPEQTYVNVWDTYDAAEGEVYWDTAHGWTPYREIIVPIAPPNGPTTFHVELAVADNDKDSRRVWVTVTAGGVTQTVSPNNPDSGELLNLLNFDLPNVPAGTDEIVIEIASYNGDGVIGDSATLVGMAANYACAPLD
ncbi:MAG: right-handed parallel beta-helix repeat-containing protein [Candidatus Promineofilum sp.]|nr:right-handed parallel beta-helix repeat-containing protein [Promineifilum sp.]